MKTRLPFIGSRYERNWPTGWIGPDQPMPWYDGPEGLPVRVTVLDNRATYFFDPGIIFWIHPLTGESSEGTEGKMDVVRFLKSYHPIENVVRLKS